MKCGFIFRSCVRILSLLGIAHVRNKVTNALGRKTDVGCLTKWSLKLSSLNETLKWLDIFPYNCPVYNIMQIPAADRELFSVYRWPVGRAELL